MKLNFRLVFLGGILIVAAGLLIWSLQPTTISAEELESLGVVVLPEPVDLGDIELIGEDGEQFGIKDLEGKWTFGFFGYTHCPDICPTTLAQLRDVAADLEAQGDDMTLANIQRMFVSVDVSRDNHEVVKAYTDSIDPGLIGVTGEPAKIQDFAASVYVGFEKLGDPEATEDYLVNHQGNIIIFNREGRCYGFIKSPFKDHHLARVFSGLARLS